MAKGPLLYIRVGAPGCGGSARRRRIAGLGLRDAIGAPDRAKGRRRTHGHCAKAKRVNRLCAILGPGS